MLDGIDIPLVISEIRPGAYYGWLGSRVVGQGGENYTNVDWRDEIQTKPTKQEIFDAWPMVEQKFIADVQNAKNAKTTLISNLRAGLIDSITLQDIVADILEESL